MRTTRIFSLGSVVGLVALIAFGIFAVAGGLGESETKASGESAREMSCPEGATDCDDTAGDAMSICAPGATDCIDAVGGDGGNDIVGICLAPGDGVTAAEDAPCVDTPSTGGGFEQTCPSDTPDCLDGCTVSSSGDVDCGVSSDGPDGGFSSPGYPGCGTPEECQRVAVEAAWTLLENDGAPGEITLLGAKSVEWPDACLGITSAGIACAEVITPGFVVTLQRDSQNYVFNTDTAGNAVAAR